MLSVDGEQPMMSVHIPEIINAVDAIWPIRGRGLKRTLALPGHN